MPTNSYDLIVVGDDLSGLIAATLCARRGLRTVVLGEEARPAVYTIGGHRLPIDPIHVPGRGTGAAARVIRELGLDHDLKRKFRDAPVDVQLVGPDVRLDLVADPAAQRRELDREWPGVAAAVAGLWEDGSELARASDELLDGPDAFPGIGFFERRDVSKQTARLADRAAAWWARASDLPPVVAAMTRLPAAAGDLTGTPSPLAIARALHRWRQGAPQLRSDGTGLRELLLEKLRAAGGELRIAAVAELVPGWNKIAAVKLASGEDLGTRQVLAAMPIHRLLRLMPTKPPRRLVDLSSTVEVLGARYVLHLIVDSAGLPEGMAPTVLFVDDAGAASAGLELSISTAEPDDHGRCAITVTAALPATAAPDSSPGIGAHPAAAALRTAILNRLEQVMPFIADHLRVVCSPYDPAITRGGDASIAGEPGRTLPAELGLIHAGSLPGSAGLAAAPYATGLKNLLLASNQVVTGLGLEGDWVVGWNAARAVCAAGRSKRDYLRDEVVRI